VAASKAAASRNLVSRSLISRASSRTKSPDRAANRVRRSNSSSSEINGPRFRPGVFIYCIAYRAMHSPLLNSASLAHRDATESGDDSLLANVVRVVRPAMVTLHTRKILLTITRVA
jgi:hypothetical protein